MTKENRKLTKGLYLVIDPSMPEKRLFDKLEIILEHKIAAIQVWDNFYSGQNMTALLQKVLEISHAREVPVLINNRWELLRSLSLDGVHFDFVPQDIDAVKRAVGRPFIIGLTCSNDLSRVHWANKEQLDYISFCSVFPASSGNSCELVKFESIEETKKITSIPVFLAGGIKPDNMEKLSGISYEGIAVISGIMDADNPREPINEYLFRLNDKPYEYKNH